MVLKRKLAYLLAGIVLTSLWAWAQQQEAQQADLNSEIESIRADARADKINIIKEVMKFKPDESAAFWPIYNRYQSDLSKLNDERIALVKSYADKFNTMSDADAKQLTEKSFDLETRRTDLKKKYYKEFVQKLPPTTASKFFQLEHRLDLLVDLKVASELPMLMVKPSESQTAEH